MIHCPSSSTTDPGQLVIEGPLRPHMSHSQDSERCSDNTPRDAGLSSDPQLHAIQVPPGWSGGGLHWLFLSQGGFTPGDSAADSGARPAKPLPFSRTALAQICHLQMTCSWESRAYIITPSPEFSSLPLQPTLWKYPRELYKLLDAETLFFAFHHLPGTRAQLLAAQELYRQDWRYHMWQGVWFQVRDSMCSKGWPRDDRQYNAESRWFGLHSG